MAITWLADVLRDAGLTVVEHAGWRTRTAGGSWSPTFGVVHATAAPRSQSDADQVRIVRDGRTGLPGPIANACVDRLGRWHVLAAGRCNTTLVGTAGPFQGLGNTNALGVEACNDNGLASPAEAWPAVQYESYYRGWAAICRRLGWTAVRLVGHKEHTPGHKTDPTFSMVSFRTHVAQVLAGEDMEVTSLTASALEQIADKVGARIMGKVPPDVWSVPGRTLAGSVEAIIGLTQGAATHAEVAALKTEIQALTSVIEQLATAIANGGGSVDTAAILAGVRQVVDEELDEQSRAGADAD